MLFINNLDCFNEFEFELFVSQRFINKNDFFFSIKVRIIDVITP